MIRATISPESRRQFLRDVDAFRKATGKSVEDIVDMIAVSGGRALAQKTLPVGFKARGKGSGESFETSIRAQVYRSLKRNLPIVRDGVSVPSVHKKERGSTGAVPRMPTDARNKRIPLPSDAVRNEAVSHVRKMQHRAGLAKAGWLTAAAELGILRRSKVPAWIARHVGKARGTATRHGRGITGYSVTLHNQVAHINSRLLPSRMIAQALKQAYGIVAFELEKVLNGGRPVSASLRRKRMR